MDSHKWPTRVPDGIFTIVFFAVLAQGNVELKHEKDVFILNTNNYHHAVNSHEIALILFHVPWCNTFRSNVLPEFEKAAKELAEVAPSILLGRLDTSTNPDIAEEVDVRGDATQFIYYHLGKPYNFDDLGTAEKLVKFLKERSIFMYSPPKPHPELVSELSQHEFKTTLKKTDFAVVAFYREDCPSCVRLLVEYETAVVNLTDIPQARFFKTNLETAPDIAQEFELFDVPVLKIFRSGKMFDFKSEHRLVSTILQYVKKQLLPPYKEFSSLAKAQGWARSYPNKAAVIGVFEKKDNPAFEVFTDIANYFRDEHNFAWVSQVPPSHSEGPREIFQEGSIAAYPPFRHMSPEDKKVHMYSGDTPTFEKLADFVNRKTVPLVGQRTTRNKNTTYAKRPLLIGYITVDWTKGKDDDTTFHRNKIAQVCGVSKDMTFAIADRREFKQELVRFGLDKYTEELLIGIIGSNGEFYPGPVVEVMNLKILTDFASDYMKNKLKPFHRTQSPPTSDESDDYPVKTVVGATFRRIVLRHDKPVLLLAHRPACPLCKTAMTVLNELAEEKSLYPGLVYAAMDTLANDPPARFVPKTYPQLFVVPPNKTLQPIPYSSKNFTKSAVMEFLDEHVANYRIKTEL